MKKIVMIGCLEETIDTLRQLLHQGQTIDSVVTLPEKQALKSGISNWVDLRDFCLVHGISLYEVQSYGMQHETDHKLISDLLPADFYVVGWQRLIPKDIVSLSGAKFLGFHGSANFLPWGRGRSPINWSIVEGRERFILHMFFISPGVDDGDVIGMEVYDITPEDSCRSLYYKTALAQACLIRRFSSLLLEGNCPSLPQVGEPFYYPKRTPEDGQIDWRQPAEAICRLVRAVTDPYPGAFAFLEGQRINVWTCQYWGDNQMFACAQTGEVIFVASHPERQEVAVKCGSGAILMTHFDASFDLQEGQVLDV